MHRSALDSPPDVAPLWPRELPEQTPLQLSIHDRHWDRRRRIILALNDSYMRSTRRGAHRIAACCDGASFFIDPATAKITPWLSRCRHRICPYCSRTRSAHVARQLLAILNPMKAPRHFVLTVKSIDKPLDDQLRTLRHDFARIRRRKFWQNAVAGGAYVIDITLNLKTLLWHPHIHIIADGTYFPQKLLRKLWHQITGSAEIVWVEAVHDYAGAARELAKYLGVPAGIDDLPPNKLRDYVQAVSGQRMLQTFGNVHGLKLDDTHPPEPKSQDVYRVKISRLVHLAHLGAETPQRLLVLIAQRWPQFASYIYHQIPTLETPPAKTDALKRMLARATGRSPPPGPSVAPKLDKAALDEKLFLAFCRYRADEQADVFLTTELFGAHAQCSQTTRPSSTWPLT